jgi:hypothetical protein
LSSEIFYVVVAPELLKTPDSFVGSDVVIASGKLASVISFLITNQMH